MHPNHRLPSLRLDDKNGDRANTCDRQSTGLSTSSLHTQKVASSPSTSCVATLASTRTWISVKLDACMQTASHTHTHTHTHTLTMQTHKPHLPPGTLDRLRGHSDRTRTKGDARKRWNYRRISGSIQGQVGLWASPRKGGALKKANALLENMLSTQPRKGSITSFVVIDAHESWFNELL